jgi:RNA binding activity-knot of a chromodomain
MTRTWVGLLLALLALFGAGCTPEMRAKRMLGKYEKVFATCRKLTEEASLKPGEHSCAKIASLAVESSLRDTGLEEGKWRPMLGEWLTETGYAPYYVDASKPAADPSEAAALAAAVDPTASATSQSAPRTQRAPDKTDGGQQAKVADAGTGADAASVEKSADKGDAGAEPKKKAAYGVGSKVSVAWGGKWWPATVLAVKDDKYLIHYDGWASSWDEWVTTARMK